MGGGVGGRESLLRNRGNASRWRKASPAGMEAPAPPHPGHPSAATTPGALLLMQPVRLWPGDTGHLLQVTLRRGKCQRAGALGAANGKGQGLRNQSRDLQGLARAIQKGFLKEASVSQTSSGKVAPHLFYDLFSICLQLTHVFSSQCI